MEHVHDAYGVYPIIYTGEDFYYSTIKEMLDKRYSHYAGIDIRKVVKITPNIFGLEMLGKIFEIFNMSCYPPGLYKTSAEEQARRGGSSIYYHVSYWGSPPRLPLA